MSASFGQSKKQVLPNQFCSCLMYLEDKHAFAIYVCHRTEQHRKKASPRAFLGNKGVELDICTKKANHIVPTFHTGLVLQSRACYPSRRLRRRPHPPVPTTRGTNLRESTTDFLQRTVSHGAVSTLSIASLPFEYTGKTQLTQTRTFCT